MRVTVKVVPVQGNAIATDYTLESGTVADALRIAQVAAGNMQVAVNGEPATEDKNLSDGDVVTLTERSAGS